MDKLILILGILIIGITIPVELLAWDNNTPYLILASLFVGGFFIGLSRTIDKQNSESVEH